MALAAPPRTPRKLSRVTQYAADVVDGRIVAGELVRLAAQRHIDDLDHADANGWKFDEDEADAVIDFFGHLTQWKGEWAGKPLTLLPWQQFCVGSVFGWMKRDGGRWVRRFKEAYISVARKNGKTTMSAGIGLWELDFDGEAGAEVYAVATKRDQAKQSWLTASEIVKASPALSRRIDQIRSTSRLIVRDTGSVFLPLGRDSHTEHGLSPSCALIDELHVHPNRDMVDAIETAIGARLQPVLWYTTTAGVEGESIYVETDDRAQRVIRKIVDDPQMFVYIATLDKDDDWTDERNFVKGNPSLGATVQLDDLKEERDKAVTTPGRQGGFKRLLLNMRTDTETAWLDLERWDACKVDALTRKGKKVIGVDLGGRQDLSAAAKITLDSQGGWDLDVRFWMPRDLLQTAEERDRVPYRAWADAGWLTLTDNEYRDDDAIANDLKEWQDGVAEFDLDAWNSTTLTKRLLDAGFEVVIVSQTFAQLSPAVAFAEEAITNGHMAHLGNPVLRWMLSNTALEETRDGGRKPVKINKNRTRRRIDGVSAMLDGLSRIRDAEEPQTWSYGAV